MKSKSIRVASEMCNLFHFNYILKSIRISKNFVFTFFCNIIKKRYQSTGHKMKQERREEREKRRERKEKREERREKREKRRLKIKQTKAKGHLAVLLLLSLRSCKIMNHQKCQITVAQISTLFHTFACFCKVLASFRLD